MAVLSDTDRSGVTRDYQRDSQTGTFGAVLRADIRAAVNAADDWVVANATSFNNALPTAAKNNLTAAQKALLLTYVVKQRYVSGA